MKINKDTNTSVLTVRPDESEPVKLECEWTGSDRSWYSDGTEVTPTSGELNTTDLTGVITLSIFTLNAIHARAAYTCKITKANTTDYTVRLGNYSLFHIYNTSLRLSTYSCTTYNL